jgi:hypothetical protein
MEKRIVFVCVVAWSLIALGGCEKQTGEALVIGKDYVATAKEGEELKDPRATNHEQWIVKVRMLDNGRRIDVRTDHAQWEKLRENDSSQGQLPRREIYRNRLGLRD